MNNFDYHFPVRIHFGQGCALDALRKEIGQYGNHVMLAYGGNSLKRTGLYDRLVKLLTDAGKTIIDFPGIMPNPTYKKVQEGARLAREKKADLILAVGGGSVSDCCKIISAQAKTDRDIWDMEYTERELPTEFIPLGIIVTASGTGSEENNGAVITHEEKRQKNALWGAFADFAILDADLTRTVPMHQVISGAFDTLSHCMETYFGKPAETNLSDELNEAVQRNTIRNLRAIKANPDDDQARNELMWASAMGENGILKLGKVTDFQCHMLEHQLGAYTDCNHGQGLAVIHPPLYRRLLGANVAKFARWAEEVWCVERADKTDEQIGAEGIEALADFIHAVGLPTSFSKMGLSLNDATLHAITESTIITPGCARKLTADELFQILKECN
ncbi:MAG: iron-containing alcohol dehydrogenase [Prevotella sp.]|nr:iron-containing alcohol dehydrogenase [Prevotella sp.]